MLPEYTFPMSILLFIKKLYFLSLYGEASLGEGKPLGVCEAVHATKYVTDKRCVRT
jgi:hypothetical protein